MSLEAYLRTCSADDSTSVVCKLCSSSSTSTMETSCGASAMSRSGSISSFGAASSMTSGGEGDCSTSLGGCLVCSVIFDSSTIDGGGCI